MNPIEKNRSFILIGHVYFILFLAMAAIFFRERTCLADCAFHIFTIIRTGTFAIFQNRYPIAIAQLLPVLGVKLKLPLNAILILYSISVPFVCYIFYLITAHKLKDYKAAIATVLAASIMLSQGFFFTWEINQAVCLLVLFFAFLLIRESYRLSHWILFGIIILVALLYHPLILIGLGYLFGYEFFRKSGWKERSLLVAFAIFIGLAITKVVFLTSPYDKDKMSVKSMLSTLPDFFSLPFLKIFTGWLIQDYYLLIIFTFIICITFIKAKKWGPLFWYCLTIFGYFTLIIVAHAGSNDSIQYYLELHYQLFALFVAIPVAYDVIPAYQKFKFLPVIFFLLIATRFFTFYINRDIFTNRLAWFDKMYAYTNQYPEHHFIINEKNLPDITSQNKLTWAGSYESLLYFASTHKNPVKSFLLTDNPSQFQWLQHEKHKLGGAFETININDIPPFYIGLTPSGYRILNSEAGAAVNASTINLVPAQEVIKAKRSDAFVRIPVKISSSTLIASGLNYAQVNLLGYRLFKDGQEIAAHTIKTPIEVDVTGSYKQMLLVEVPKEAGNYQVKPVLLPEDQTFWNRPAVALLVE